MGDAVFKAISDPQRRKILKFLRGGPQSAGQIAQAFEITKGSLSYHLNILKAADLVRCERRAGTDLLTQHEGVRRLLSDIGMRPLIRVFPAAA